MRTSKQHKQVPCRRGRRKGQGGFNLAEVLVGLSAVALAGSLGGPPLAGFLHRSKVEGFAYDVSAVMRASRAIATTRGANTVVALDVDAGAIVAFADVNGETVTDLADGLFNPLDGLPYRRTDYEIARIPLPTGVHFEEPGGKQDEESIIGFDNSDPLPQGEAIFLEDGSVDAPGAIRIADERGNYFEIATTSRAGRVEVRKWDGNAYWLSRGEGDGWEWH